MQTAQAQSGLNRDTAQEQQLTNMVGQNTPDGTLSYSQTGNNSFVDSQGKTVNIPQFTATTTLSPQQQAIADESNKAKLNLGKLAAQQSGALTDQLSKPFSYTGSDAENMAFDLGSKRLTPKFAQDRDALRTQLIASGLRPGTEAYDQQVTQQGQTENDAWDQLTLGAQQQGYNQALATYNEPVNSISALMSGSQVTSPTFASTPTASVGGVDYTGMVNSNYQQQVASSNAAMGGLFGLASAPFQAMKLSDARLKSNIRRVGMLDNGLSVYSYRFGDGPTEIGLIAQEVEQFRPDAVAVHPSGFKMVDYGKASV
jgi:hypothetical protein